MNIKEIKSNEIQMNKKELWDSLKDEEKTISIGLFLEEAENDKSFNIRNKAEIFNCIKEKLEHIKELELISQYKNGEITVRGAEFKDITADNVIINMFNDASCNVYGNALVITHGSGSVTLFNQKAKIIQKSKKTTIIYRYNKVQNEK